METITNQQLVEIMLTLEELFLVKFHELDDNRVNDKFKFKMSQLSVNSVLKDLEPVYKEIKHRRKRDGKFKWKRKQIVLQSKMNKL